MECRKISVLSGIKLLEESGLGRIRRTKTGLARGRLVLSHWWCGRGLGLKQRRCWAFHENSAGHILISGGVRILGCEVRRWGPEPDSFTVLFSVYGDR